jgi:hypothetical protein
MKKQMQIQIKDLQLLPEKKEFRKTTFSSTLKKGQSKRLDHLKKKW